MFIFASNLFFLKRTIPCYTVLYVPAPGFILYPCCAVLSRSVMPNPATPWTPARLLCPQDSPAKSTGLGCHALLQFFYTQKFVNAFSLLLLTSPPLRPPTPPLAIQQTYALYLSACFFQTTYLSEIIQYLSFSVLFHLAQCSRGPSMLSQMANFSF